MALINATFQWINDNLKDSIDFVVWTGDSARHDYDEQIPRTIDQVVEQNTFLVDKFVEVFGKANNIDDTDPASDFTIPIVPTFGNNDILPHNIFLPGPNIWTKKYLHIWRTLIPEEQRHSFERGGWFFVEVIPNRLAVFSLNTLYFFHNNAAVDGCAKKSEPGYQHFEWLRIQLQLMREKGLKVIIMGHVPPARTDSKSSWDETCWHKYTLWMKNYRDVIIGSVYGHMNIDHFMLQDAKQISQKVMDGKVAGVAAKAMDDYLGIQSSASYLTDLRASWSSLPISIEIEGLEHDAEESELKKRRKHKKSKKEKKRDKLYKKIGGPFAELYSVTLVSPSIVPNYFPTLRVIEYNITGLDSNVSPEIDTMRKPRSGYTDEPPSCLDDSDGEEYDTERRHTKKGKKKRKPQKPSRPKFTVPECPSPVDLPGPAYSPQTFTWLGYTQYYANLTKFNAQATSAKDSPKPEFEFEVEYDTRDDMIFNLTDLTARSYIDLAGRIGRYKAVSTSKSKKKEEKRQKQKRINETWFTFVRRAFVGTRDENEIEEGFG